MPPFGERFAALVLERKHRRVVRVALPYVVAACAVVQTASPFFPPLHVPACVLRFVAVVIILDFVLAPILARAFDWAGSGIEATAAEARVG